MSSHASQTEIAYWLALNRAPNLGKRQKEKIFSYYKSLKELFTATKAELKHLALHPKLLAYLKAPDWQGVELDMVWLQSKHHHIITLHDSNYPYLLRQISNPPLLLYVWGNPACLNLAQIAIVGSRNPSHQGIENAHGFAQQLSRSGFVITSGLARGIDGVSHRGCLAAQGQTIAVLGSGLEQVYPAQHRDLAAEIAANGAMISEYPPQTKPLAYNFPARNRIISGLSLGVWVVEATLRSGSLITARLALEQGREVFATPGSIHNPLARGCHDLLRQGAKLVETCHDIIEELGALNAARAEDALQKNLDSTLADEDMNLVECVGFEPTTIDRIVARSHLPVSKVLAKLSELELRGVVISSPLGYERRVDKSHYPEIQQ